MNVLLDHVMSLEHVGELFVKIVLMIVLNILHLDVAHMNVDVYVDYLMKIWGQNYALIVTYVVDKHAGTFRELRNNYMNVIYV
jgi:hypothetical protein